MGLWQRVPPTVYDAFGELLIVGPDGPKRVFLKVMAELAFDRKTLYLKMGLVGTEKDLDGLQPSQERNHRSVSQGGLKRVL